MILVVHALAGAAIASQVKITWLGWILAFFSHFILDLIPHYDYNLKGFALGWKSKNFWLVALKVVLDLAAGLILIIIFNNHKGNLLNILIGGFLGMLPDGLTAASYLFKNRGWKKLFIRGTINMNRAEPANNFSYKISNFYQKIHNNIRYQPLRNPRSFWGIINQIIVSLTALLLI
ncbi:MAG: hypothetical protein Q8N90_03475 [bacterium]|nr:hypothetical protein [bacterium]